jgi:hypothetical protein
MTNGYTETLVNFMKKKWVSFVILGGSLILTVYWFKITHQSWHRLMTAAYFVTR